MAKEIILYNLRDDVTDEDYKKWCDEYKGPTLLRLDSVKSFTLVSQLGGVKGNGMESIPPEETKPPFKYVGILDSTSLEDWNKDRNSKIFKEEFLKWVDIFGLKGWRFHFVCSDLEDERGRVTYGTVDRVATVVLNKNWKEPKGIDITEKDIRECAFHECCEIWFARIRDIAKQRFGLLEEDIDEEVHNLIRTLENILWEKY